MPRRFILALLSVPALPTLVYLLGGWATVSVDELPEYLVAGQPAAITFTVRQHGLHLVDGLSPTVEARNGDEKTGVIVARAKGAGRYTAQLPISGPGEWTIAIRNGFGPAPSVVRRGPDLTLTTLLPIVAIAPHASSPPAADPSERGARLFVAKGCVTCHVHGAVDRPSLIPAGAALTSRRYPADYLGKLLADPVAVRGPRTTMPNLALRPAEITALVAFINSPPRLARK